MEKLRLDKRYKVKKYSRITPDELIQFSDKYKSEEGFIIETKKSEIIKQLINQKS